MKPAKQQVHDFWDEAACGETLYLSGGDREAYRAQMAERYRLEPFIPPFARFEDARNKSVLEIGVGLGADHQRFAEAGAVLSGIDLTERAVEHTRARFALFNLTADVRQGDGEHLPHSDNTFDMVYSWGVLHHSPDTLQAIGEVYRVLKPGGEARIMIYHTWSLVGLMLWVRYALLRVRPFTPLSAIYARHLESPGTKAYTIAEARHLFGDFQNVQIETRLTHGDLLTSGAGQRHSGPLLSLARALWPRPLIRALFPNNGLFMLISAQK